MRRISALAWIAMTCFTSLVAAVEVKNVRLCLGAYGATREEKRFLPGEILLLMYDIDDLAPDAKTGKVSYESLLEVFDSKNRLVAPGMKLPPQEVVVQLGGSSIPGDLVLPMSTEHPPGPYTVKLTLTDRVSKKTTTLSYPFELLKKTEFGLFRLSAPGFGLPGNHYPVTFYLANTPLREKDGDKKKGEFKGLPDVDIIMRVFEEGKKAEVAKPVLTQLPAQLPDRFDPELLPVTHTIYLNRPGRFIVVMEVHDKIKGHKLKTQWPFTVLQLK